MKRKDTMLFVISTVACVLMLVTTASAQGIRSSDFTGGTLDTFWTFIDPRGGCVQEMTGSQARIVMPYGLSRDPLSSGQAGNRAPRIMQRVGPQGSDVGDFQVYAKFDGIQNTPFQIQGIMVIQDDKNYVRSEIYSDTTNVLKYLLYTFNNLGDYEHQIEGVITPPLGTTPLFMRLRRVDSTWTQYYTANISGPWILTASTNHQMNVDSIGVYGANSNAVLPPGDTTAPAFTASFDYFTTTDPLVPVQIGSFTAKALSNGQVRLSWMTISETNNLGFEVQKSFDGTENFQTVPNSFVEGHGTTSEANYYAYTDVSTSIGSWYYRLKQIDLDGSFHYGEAVHVDVLTVVREDGKQTPTAFTLEQNYPNPFNPSTIITYEVPKESRVTLEVFNLIGQKVATLVDEVKSAGFYARPFNASTLTTGVYMYKLTAGGFSFTRKMVLVK